MQISSVVVCGPGKIRKRNQDNYYFDGMCSSDPSDTSIQRLQSSTHNSTVYAVADGMGGEKYSEIASLLAVGSAWKIDVHRGRDELMQYVSDQNEMFCRFITDKDGMRSGTTFVELCICGKTADLVNVGDSRAYLFRGGCLTQLSRNHTVIRQVVEFGVVPPRPPAGILTSTG